MQMEHWESRALFIFKTQSCANVIRLWGCYRGADKSLARPGRKQANVSVRMPWISFGASPCKEKKNRWQLASRYCWNRARPWHASELVPFLVGLRTYQHPGSCDPLARPSSCFLKRIIANLDFTLAFVLCVSTNLPYQESNWFRIVMYSFVPLILICLFNEMQSVVLSCAFSLFLGEGGCIYYNHFLLCDSVNIAIYLCIYVMFV